MKSLLRVGMLTAMFGASLVNFAQVATPEQKGPYAAREDMATFNMETKLGSFKLIDGEGRLDVRFRGTLLLTKHTKGEMRIVEGKLRKEYDKNGRVVYTGQARVVITGQWRGIQWFGSDMSAVWFGKGFARLTGEFDRDLKTGSFWYDGEDKSAFPSSSVISLPLPPANYGANTKLTPTPRKGGTASGGGN